NGEIEFRAYIPNDSGVESVSLGGDFTGWDNRLIKMNADPENDKEGYTLYKIIVPGLYGPHAFKFVFEKLGFGQYWMENIETLSPYIVNDAYGINNALVWSVRHRKDPFIQGVLRGVLQRLENSAEEGALQRVQVAEKFPIEEYPEMASVFYPLRRRITREDSERVTLVQAAPDRLKTSIFQVSLRAFADQEAGISGIQGFIDWYENLLSQTDGDSPFTDVLIFPPFEIGVDHRLGTIGSPWSVKDYQRTDPQVGTPEELQAGINKLQTMGLRVIMDLPWHSTSYDNSLRSDHPDWYLNLERMEKYANFVDRYKDILPIDLERAEVRALIVEQVSRVVSYYGLDGIRFDGATFDTVPMGAYLDISHDIQKRYPQLFIIAEGREPALHQTSQVTYGWDILFTMGDIIRRKGDVKSSQFTELLNRMIVEAIRRVNGGLKLLGGRTQDDTFFLWDDSYPSREAIVFGLPLSVPMIWMMSLLHGHVNGDTQFFGNENRQIKLEDFHIDGIDSVYLDQLRRLMQIRNSSAALLYGDLQLMNPLAASDDQNQVFYMRSFGKQKIIVLSDIRGREGNTTFEVPLIDEWDLTGEDEEQQYWLGDIITGEGIALGLKDVKDIKNRRKALKVYFPENRTLYLSFSRWNPQIHRQIPAAKSGFRIEFSNQMMNIDKRIVSANKKRFSTPDHIGFIRPLYTFYWTLLRHNNRTPMIDSKIINGNFNSLRVDTNVDYGQAEKVFEWIKRLCTDEDLSEAVKGDLYILELGNPKMKTFARTDGQNIFAVTMNLGEDPANSEKIRFNALPIQEEAYYQVSIIDPRNLEKPVVSLMQGSQIIIEGVDLQDLDIFESRMVIIREMSGVDGRQEKAPASPAMDEDARVDQAFFNGLISVAQERSQEEDLAKVSAAVQWLNEKIRGPNSEEILDDKNIKIHTLDTRSMMHDAGSKIRDAGLLGLPRFPGAYLPQDLIYAHGVYRDGVLHIYMTEAMWEEVSKGEHGAISVERIGEKIDEGDQTSVLSAIRYPLLSEFIDHEYFENVEASEFSIDEDSRHQYAAE
ncbi:MAG: hypothetical protein Q8Q33_01075, partial [Chlamydiota bacterium]|nr:hypothetical protein [Chlamydiota bacterium]